MMEGTPARQSVPKRMMRLTRPSRVYSRRKIAVPTPKGVAMRIGHGGQGQGADDGGEDPAGPAHLRRGDSRKKSRCRSGRPSRRTW